MIKPIQLLKETYAAYKLNFKKLITMSVPVLIVTYIMSFASGQSSALIESQSYGSSLILSSIVFLICLFAIAFFLAPAINRAVQRNEDTGAFDVKGAYDFMKSNKWKWFMTNVWGALYMLGRIWIYFIPVVAVLIYAIVQGGNSMIAILLSLSVVIFAIGVMLNIHRFLLFKTIIFSKDISARDAVRESVALGKGHVKDMWLLILTMVLIGLAVGVFSLIVGVVTGAFGASKEFLDMYVSPLITLLVTSPMLLIVTAKAYVKVRMPIIPSVPVEEVHIA